jgi:hypothetical protein
MHNRHDPLPKKILRRALGSDGAFTSEMEVSPDAQRFDSYFVPGPEHAAHRRDLLDRLAAGPVAFEAFHSNPGPDALIECIRKLLNARHILGLAKPPQPQPFLWVLSPGRLVSGLEAMGARPKQGFPPGVYEAPPGFHSGAVVLSELPETRETFLLRLMARGRTLRRALAELRRLPETTREAEVALPVLIEYRIEALESPSRTPEDEEFLMETQGIVETWKQKLKDEGRREALVAFYEARFGPVPADIRSAVERARDEATLETWIQLFATRSADEIAAALQVR